MSRREILLRQQQLQQYGSVDATRRRRPPVIVESSSSSSSQASNSSIILKFCLPSPPQFLPPSQENPNFPKPTYSYNESSQTRSRSPTSPLQQRSQVSQLQEVQIEIGIVQDQFEQIDTAPSQQVDEPIEIDDNESVLSEEEPDIEPEEIVSHFGRGQNCQYRIRWSDGTHTLNRTSEVANVVPQLLNDYRLRCRRENTRVYCERLRSIERSL